jgi:hypothetical protein
MLRLLRSAILTLLVATVGASDGCVYVFGLCQASPSAIASLFSRSDVAVDT